MIHVPMSKSGVPTPCSLSVSLQVDSRSRPHSLRGVNDYRECQGFILPKQELGVAALSARQDQNGKTDSRRWQQAQRWEGIPLA